MVHAVFTCVHVESAVHVPHGALPVAEKVEPTTQATWHTVSVVVVHAAFTPRGHVASAAHVSHGTAVARALPYLPEGQSAHDSLPAVS